MKNKILAIILMFAFATILISCSRDPMVAFIKNGTSAGSDTYTVNISFVDDSEYKDKFLDVLIKSDTDNFAFNYTNEYEAANVDLNIAEKDKWNSLSYLINSASSQVTAGVMAFKEKKNMTFMIKSELKGILSFKVVCGDKQVNTEDETILVNQNDVSNDFSLKINS